MVFSPHLNMYYYLRQLIFSAKKLCGIVTRGENSHQSVIQSFSHSVIVLTPGGHPRSVKVLAQGGGGASQILLMCETL